MLPLACTNKSTRNDKQFKCHMHGLNRTFFSKNTLCKFTQNLLWFLLNLHQHFCNFCGHICHYVVYISAYPALKCKQLWQRGIMSYTYLLFSGTAFHVFWVIMEILWICIFTVAYNFIYRNVHLSIGKHTHNQQNMSKAYSKKLIMKIKMDFLHILRMQIYNFHS